MKTLSYSLCGNVEAILQGPNHKRELMLVVANNPLIAADDYDLSEVIRGFVDGGGCYAVMVPGGNPSQSDADLCSYQSSAVRHWRKTHESARVLVERLRMQFRKEAEAEQDNEVKRQKLDAVSRVALIVPRADAELLRFTISVLPPAPASDTRLWLLFQGIGILQDPLNYSCGQVVLTGVGHPRLEITAVSTFASRPGLQTPVNPRSHHDRDALIRYSLPVLRAWDKADREKIDIDLGTESMWKTDQIGQ